MDKQRYETGLRVRKEVLGAEFVERALSGATDFNRHFQELVTEYCWGGVWGSEVLPRKTRSMLNLCMLAALNRPHEFELHFRGALTQRLHARRAARRARADRDLLRHSRRGRSLPYRSPRPGRAGPGEGRRT